MQQRQKSEIDTDMVQTGRWFGLNLYPEGGELWVVNSTMPFQENGTLPMAIGIKSTYNMGDDEMRKSLGLAEMRERSPDLLWKV